MRRLIFPLVLTLAAHTLFLGLAGDWLERKVQQRYQVVPLALGLSYRETPKSAPAPAKVLPGAKEPVKPPPAPAKATPPPPPNKEKTIQEKPKPVEKVEKKREVVEKPKKTIVEKPKKKPRKKLVKKEKKRSDNIKPVAKPVKDPEPKPVKQLERKSTAKRSPPPPTPKRVSETRPPKTTQDFALASSAASPKKDIPQSAGMQRQERVASLPPAEPVKEAIPLYRENPPPKYPRIARKRGYHGTVLLEVLINTAGKVEDLRVLKSSGHSVLDQAAVKSVRKWLFEPGQKGEQKVEMWVKLPIRFQLRDKGS